MPVQSKRPWQRKRITQKVSKTRNTGHVTPDIKTLRQNSNKNNSSSTVQETEHNRPPEVIMLSDSDCDEQSNASNGVGTEVITIADVTDVPPPPRTEQAIKQAVHDVIDITLSDEEDNGRFIVCLFLHIKILPFSFSCCARHIDEIVNFTFKWLFTILLFFMGLF